MTTRRNAIALAALALASFAVTAARHAQPAFAAQPTHYTGLVKGVAVGGYDPVAYFTQKTAVPGRPDITARHDGVEWRFASPEHRTLFLANPARYIPQYGGYCAWAVSQGYTAKGDPRAWTVVGDKLYLNYDKGVQKDWEKDIPGHVRKGDANWPKVLAK